MDVEPPSVSSETQSAVVVGSAILGGLVLGVGLVVLRVSVLGGAWLAAIGLSVLLAAQFATDVVREDAAISDRRRRLSLALAALAAVLFLAFVVATFAGFEPVRIRPRG